MIKTIHTLLTLVTMAVLWTACSDKIVSGEDSGRAIGFSCGTLMSRARETTTDNINSFRVSAVWKKDASNYVDNYMDAQSVEKNAENVWTYSPVRNIPSYGTVDFFAYSPADASVSKFTISGTTHDRLSLTYDVTTDHVKQHDFMVAEALEVNTASVHLYFRHTLSLIRVAAKSITEAYTFRITEVKLHNIYRQGVLTGETSASPGKTTTWTWSNQAIPTTYTIIQDSPVDAVSGSYTPIPDSGTGPLMILPQTVGTDAFVRVAYEVYDNGSNKLKDVTTDFPLDLTFGMGQQYVLNINLSYQSTRSQSASPSSSLHITVEDEQKP